jgi:hypothetical protein
MHHKSTGETLKRQLVRLWFQRWTCRRYLANPQCSTGGLLYREAICWLVFRGWVWCVGAGLAVADVPGDVVKLLQRCSAFNEGTK